MALRRTVFSSVVVMAVTLGITAVPQSATACGGLFCDGGPQPMPVDQSGENILFVWQNDHIEAHIQIQYEGEAANFGWVIPLQSVPEFSVGSEPLFQSLLAGSVPTYGFTQTFDDCSFGDEGTGGLGGAASAGEDRGAGGTGGDDGGGGGPEVILRETVGAFEIEVLQGGTAQGVMDWLAANNYLQDETALPILDEYLQEGHLFAAVKLRGGAGVDEIHPIALSFQGTEPCVPLRLTRIAAVDDMAVRSFFLGSARMVPKNYRHVLVNPLKIDWLNFASNYKDIITEAVDEDHADGRAFVTEYAGPSQVVSTSGVFDLAWDGDAFATANALDLDTLLAQQNLLVCDFDFGNGCSFTHPLIEGLLTEYISVPEGVAAADFFADVDTYAGQTDLSMWDGAAFATAFTLRVVEPGVHAADLLAQNAYLTRMYTTISPHEMTEDPMFWENGSLPEVSSQQMGTLRTLCSNDQVFTLPDGREVFLPSGSTWPQFPNEPGGVDGSMPSSEIIETVPENGAPMQLVDNTETINAVLQSWNEQHSWDGIGPGGSGGDSDGDDTDAEPGQGGAETSSGGCGCASDEPTSIWAAGAPLGGLLLLRRRRRLR